MHPQTHSFSITPLLDALVERKASDLYLTVGYPPTLRFGERMMTLGDSALSEPDVIAMLGEILSADLLEDFAATLELNTGLNYRNLARLRINVFRQQQQTGAVFRRIQNEIPTIESLGLPDIYRDMIMERRGLILVVGPTSSGKSTSLAAMVGHRNRNSSGHIITIEDPIEYVHTHAGCIITQRDMGIDTYSFNMALKNALRQRPDVVLIGEIRDAEAMEHALHFAETGHLCVATLHARNAYQAVHHILHFFPEEKHRQVLHNMAMNLRGIFSQRLVDNTQGGRSLALEVMLNRGHIRTLIEENKIRDIRELMEKSGEQGMVTFDQSLFALYNNGTITRETALAEADNEANLRLMITQRDTGKMLKDRNFRQ